MVLFFFALLAAAPLMWMSVDPNAGNTLLSMTSGSKSSSLKLYRVANTAGNDIKILAESADCARFFAYDSGHVREEKNATVFLYDEQQLAELKISGSATGRAIREGVPGVLKSVGSGIVIEQAGKVYVPLTVIDSV